MMKSIKFEENFMKNLRKIYEISYKLGRHIVQNLNKWCNLKVFFEKLKKKFS